MLYEEHVDKEQKNYTKESWKIFYKAFMNAKKVLKNPQVTTDQVAESRFMLIEAAEGLIEKINE
ncbi:hypothetical protein [Metabacillus halosaccharovorans]|uniref:hypothetical protein n=1 Tax=Metabacillus halosaccharovorans TaxID=930124 RepID=UPI0037356329